MKPLVLCLAAYAAVLAVIGVTLTVLGVSDFYVGCTLGGALTPLARRTPGVLRHVLSR